MEVALEVRTRHPMPHDTAFVAVVVDDDVKHSGSPLRPVVSKGGERPLRSGSLRLSPSISLGFESVQSVGGGF
jgi:hypothetical protein